MPTPPLFPLRPLAPDTPAPVETLRFLADVRTAYDGTESRRPLRDYPRHEYAWPIASRTAAERAQVLQLGRGGEYVLPLWMHAVPGGQPLARGISARPDALYVVRTAAGLSVTDAAGTQQPDVIEYAPALIARASLSASVSVYANGALALAQSEWRATDYREAFPSLASLGLPTAQGPEDVLPVVHAQPWLTTRDGGPDELGIEATADVLDSDSGLWSETMRYTKDVRQLRLILRGADISKLRAFFAAMRGRAGAFFYVEPGKQNTVENRLLVRFDSDALSLTYMTNNVARANVALRSI